MMANDGKLLLLDVVSVFEKITRRSGMLQGAVSDSFVTQTGCANVQRRTLNGTCDVYELNLACFSYLLWHSGDLWFVADAETIGQNATGKPKVVL